MSNHDEPPVTEKSEAPSKSDETTSGDQGGSSEGKATSSTDSESLESLKQELEETRRKAAENWDLFLRARADADNIRRRAMLDVENAHKYGIEKFAKEILLVVDSLDHGLSATSEEGEKGLREGLELTYKLLLDTLEKFGIKQINPIGESFDPMFHEALSSQANADVEPNKILVVIQKGFTLQDRMLRPARVIVSRTDA